MNDDRLTAAKYREHIETMADVIEDQLEADNSLEATDLIWEEVDSSHYIMYYDHNLEVLQYAANEPQEWKHMVNDTANWQRVIQVMAHSAMDMDLYEELRDRGVEF